jgi:ferric-dicitrate binding protein FerR (iron transport regulator)
LDELIIKVLDGEASPAESEEVERWRAEDPEHQARYETVRRVWFATRPAPLPDAVDGSVVPRVLQAATLREEEARRVPPARRLPSRALLRWALPMAATVGAVGLGIHLWTRGPAPSVVLEASGAGSETFVLDDGSFVRLAPGTRLIHKETAEERRYELDGRGFFAVARDEDRPFVVETDGVETRVLGTRFEVREVPGEGPQVAVLEGRVEVRNSFGQAELAAGEVSVASPGQPPTRTRPDDILDLLDWPEGTLLFQSTPLAQVSEEVARRYGVEVVVEGRALRSKRISAWYREESFREVIESLCAATSATCSVSDTLAVLR